MLLAFYFWIYQFNTLTLWSSLSQVTARACRSWVGYLCWWMTQTMWTCSSSRIQNTVSPSSLLHFLLKIWKPVPLSVGGGWKREGVGVLERIVTAKYLIYSILPFLPFFEANVDSRIGWETGCFYVVLSFDMFPEEECWSGPLYNHKVRSLDKCMLLQAVWLRFCKQHCPLDWEGVVKTAFSPVC